MHAWEKAVTGMLVGLVNVVLLELLKSTLNFQKFKALELRFIRKAVDGSGGSVDPSRSAASKLG